MSAADPGSWRRHRREEARELEVSRQADTIRPANQTCGETQTELCSVPGKGEIRTTLAARKRPAGPHPGFRGGARQRGGEAGRLESRGDRAGGRPARTAEGGGRWRGLQQRACEEAVTSVCIWLSWRQRPSTGEPRTGRGVARSGSNGAIFSAGEPGPGGHISSPGAGKEQGARARAKRTRWKADDVRAPAPQPLWASEQTLQRTGERGIVLDVI